MSRDRALVIRGALLTLGFWFLADNVWQAVAASILVGSAQIFVENAEPTRPTWPAAGDAS